MITAEEARERTDKAYANNEYIKDVLSRMEKEIKNACDLGHNTVALYVSEPGIYKIKDTVINELIKCGYKACYVTGQQYNEIYVTFKISW